MYRSLSTAAIPLHKCAPMKMHSPIIFTDTIQARTITDEIIPLQSGANLEVHFHSLPSWPARKNIK